LWKTARNIHSAIRWKKFLRSLDRYEFVVVVVVLWITSMMLLLLCSW
jgi:hypothetical protein